MKRKGLSLRRRTETLEGHTVKMKKIASFLDGVCLTMVDLTMRQVETLFGELEYIQLKLQVLGVDSASQ